MKFDWNLDERLQDLAGQAKRAVTTDDITLHAETYIFPGDFYLSDEERAKISEAFPETESFFGQLTIGYRAVLVSGLHAKVEPLEFDLPHVTVAGELSATKEFVSDASLSALESWALGLGKALTRSMLGLIGNGYLIFMKNEIEEREAKEAAANV